MNIWLIVAAIDLPLGLYAAAIDPWCAPLFFVWVGYGLWASLEVGI